MQRKRIAWRRMLRQRSISGDQLWGCDEIKRSRGQHRQVQRLANVTSVLRTARVMVEEAAARREIQQHRASQHRQRPARRLSRDESSVDSPTLLHALPRQRITFDAPASRMGVES